jgi:Fic family protein
MIHPFTDGNGRVGREIFNYMLTRIGYPKLLFLGSDRTTYIKSLKMGNDEKYADMIEVFSDLITKQRLDILKENLKKVVVPPKKTGQLRITDYFTRSSRSNERVASR